MNETINPYKPLGARADAHPHQPLVGQSGGTKPLERARPRGARRAQPASPTGPAGPYIGRRHFLLATTRRQSTTASRAAPSLYVPPFPVLAAMARHFVLNTGAKIPSVGLGTWQSDPGVVGNAVYAAVKVRTNPRPRPVFFSLR